MKDKNQKVKPTSGAQKVEWNLKNEYQFIPFDEELFEKRFREVLAEPLEPELIEICKALSKH